uniref:Uncharacterized protein n=1 Tax=Panagrolaimus superbus TaxID=310955 RepID=A0A914Z8L3_9BILA
MCLSDLCDGYAELGKTMLELEYAKLGYPDLQSLIQKFNIHSNPNGMLNTYVYGTTENGAAGVIDLMQKTIENPRPPPYGFPRNASHQPPIYQSSRALPSIPELSSSVSSKGAPVPFSPMSFRPIVIHGSSSDVPPSQFPLPKSDSSPTLPGSSQSLSEVPPLQLPKSDSSASRQGSSDHIKPSTDASRRFKNLNVNALSITEAASRASQGVVTPVGLSVFTAQHTPEQNEIIVGPHNLGATSSFETEEFGKQIFCYNFG